MAAPVGNQFWKLQYKHGRDKIFKNPQLLWEAACEYFQWCDENPLETLEFNGKDAVGCIVPKMRAYTWSGLECYVGIYSLRDYKTNPDYEAFSQVITRISAIMYTQKFEGAAAGLLNANLISRDLGLADKKEISGELGVKPITGMKIL
ncbi:DNA-packaging protein [Spirosoma profusum]|uniref:DNA-packaging protein n=1 Tax=Spirosoma profusum TaxID=2771354 RepID=UPI001CC23A94|nr:DNA-packaging protein [Spirosoma profusum]